MALGPHPAGRLHRQLRLLQQVRPDERRPALRSQWGVLMEQLSFDIAVIDPEAHRVQVARKPRKCLCCGGTFNSAHAGHRICSSCKELDIWSSPNEFSVAVSF